jgi:hypothetical protein
VLFVQFLLPEARFQLACSFQTANFLKVQQLALVPPAEQS